MSNDQRTALLDSLTATPRQTAGELGTTTQELDLLMAQGLVQRVGNRKTGKRGKPPVEWAVAGVKLTDLEHAAVLDAEQRVAIVKRYDTICNRMWRLREAGERDSDAYNRLADEKAAIYEVTGGDAPVARVNDWKLVGETDDDLAEDGTLVLA